ALAAVVIVVAGLSFAREVVGPLALAIVIVIICEPVRQPLMRRGLPSWLGARIVIAVAYVILLAMGALMWFAGVQFAGLVVDLASDGAVTRQLQDLAGWLTDIGLGQEATDAVASLIAPANLLKVVQSVGGTVIATATALFFVFAYIIF